jgi:hypothetical protein
MSEKTIHEIKGDFGSEGAAILNSYHDSLNQIKAQREPEAGGYLDRLTDEQRMSLLREQKAEQTREIHSPTVETYRAEIERYHEELFGRVGYLKDRLFKVEDAGALSRVALATDNELGTLLEIAAHAGNTELGRAVFVAAEQRGARACVRDGLAAREQEELIERLEALEEALEQKGSRRYGT